MDQSDPTDTAGHRRALIARLVRLRKANGLTQAAVAGLMRVRQPLIAEIESGRTDLRLSTLERYAGAVSLGRFEFDVVRDASRSRRMGGVAEALAPYGSAVDEADFWSRPSLDDLVAEQGTTAIVDPGVLVLEGVSEGEWDDFFSAMGIAG